MGIALHKENVSRPLSDSQESTFEYKWGNTSKNKCQYAHTCNDLATTSQVGTELPYLSSTASSFPLV